ncbi:VWA domain-containing protein [Enterococcus avium]|uniref:SpaA isopeptide-forming pilin-related protein n=1 Tax=Enterococcus avium TaxID=33945 RepID=UPI00159D5717|nr:SpaA isopeptide-forming pilin-related protein [Enterococcus avium]NVN78089.1 VWA domain-containing protein [Enterococcus avium]
MLRRKLRFLIVLGVIFSSLTGLLGVRTQTFAETNTKVLLDESFLNVSYETELTEKGNVFRIKLKREADSKQKKSRVKVKILTESDEVIDYPVVDGMEETDEWLNEKEFTPSANYELELLLPKKEKRLQLFIELNEQKEMSENDSDTDVLGLTEPLLLEMSKTDSSKSSKKEPTSSLASEKVPPTTSSYSLYSEQNSLSPLAGISANSLTRENSYTNKAPSYKTDNGEYPEYSWQPNGQTNVINHQGGKDNAAANVWDGLQNWDTSTDNYKNSYIYYGVGEKAQGDIALRKYASETAKEDEFNVSLNVRGDSLTKPGVDVMFVLDNSASMIYNNPESLVNGRLRKDVSVESLGKLIDQFKKNIPDNLGYLRLGSVIFGSDVISTSNLSAQYSDWDQMVTNYQAASTQGHQTYTQGGLIEAQKRLLADNNGRRKVIFLLTDGFPNRSRKPVKGKKDSTIFPSQVRITEYVASELGDSLQSNGSTSLYVLNNPPWSDVDRRFTIPNIEGGAALKIESHLDMANSQAADIRETGTEIQAIAMGYHSGTLEYHTPEELIKGLYRMTTQRANTTGDSESDYYFYQAQDLQGFEDSFQDWFQSTLTTVEHGVIEDPLGDMVELVGTPVVTDVSLRNGLGTESINTDRMAVVDNSDSRKVKVTNINLYGNQEIEINYKVRLKTEDSSFISGKWYPANGKTTLHVSPDRTTDKLDFGVPSVRASTEDFVIPVKKIWSNDNDNRWQMRKEVTAVLQKKDGTKWIDLHEVNLNEGNDWTNQFPAVSGNSTIEYRVIEKISNLYRVPGYANPTYSQESFTSSNLESAGITITNRLLTTDFSFKKVMENGQPFTISDEKRPKFTLTETIKSIEVVRDVAPDDEGVVHFTNLPAGIYRVSETFVPEGFKKCDDFTFTVAERSDGTGVIATSTNKTIVNELKEYKLTVIKTNELGAEIEGAAFQLRNSSGTYNKTISTGSTFTFTGLEPGAYFLKEVTAPDSYVGLNKEIAIDIFDNGSVSIEDHTLITKSVNLNGTENLITMKVKNKRQFGVLPKTGSFGNRYFILFSIICLVIGSGLGAVYLYVNRRRG